MIGLVCINGKSTLYVIRRHRNLEAMAELWIHLGVPGSGFGAEHWGRGFAFHVLHEDR